VIEELMLAGSEVTMRLASVWLCCFAALCGAYLLLLGLYEGSWDHSGLMASLIGLNMALSPDNLVVFMMFLTDLPLVSHRRVISDGFLFASALRITTMLATARLLEAFAPLQMVLAVLVLTKGAQLLFEGWRKSQSTTAAEGTAEGTMAEEADGSLDKHWMVATIRRCVDIKWTEETDGRCCVCEPSTQELGTCGVAQRCALTRTAVLAMAIGVGDLTFSSDNIAAALALSTDGYTLTVSITLSILLLRPVFFLMAAFIRYLDALDTALGVILVLIGTKLCLGFAGIETPLWLFVGLLTTWRLLVLGYTIGRVYNNRT
jgi:tellurite resistance protein TerC